MISNAELNGLEMGTGTDYPIDEAGISGLGVPQTKSADTSYDGRDGVFAAPDYLDVAPITIPLILNGADTDAALALLDALNTAWAPARDGVDLELGIAVGTGWSKIYLGRPRGVEADLTEVGNGVILALCHFDATTPLPAEGGS